MVAQLLVPNPPAMTVARTPAIMKGGTSLKRGSGAGDSPQTPAAVKPIGSPATRQPPKKDRAGKGAGDAAKGSTATPPSLADVAIHTPPLVAPAGGGVGAPEDGCAADEVLAYVLRSELAQKELVEDLEQRTAEHVNQFRQEMHERFPQADKFVSKGILETRFLDLTRRLDKFAEKIQTHTLRTESLEGNFKERVNVAFGIVDAEYRKLKALTRMWSTTQSRARRPPAPLRAPPATPC